MKSRLFHIFCASFSFCFSAYFFCCCFELHPGGTPYNGPYASGEAPPERGTFFFRLHRYERVGISLAEVNEIVGECVISVCKMVLRGLACEQALCLGKK